MAILVAEKSIPVQRIYKNSLEEVIRVDTIFMEPTTTALSSGSNARTFKRVVKTEVYWKTTRVVDEIELITTADTVESVSGDYLFVEWTTGNAGTTVRCNMSDLPGVGDTV